jgi:hypothetical protein
MTTAIDYTSSEGQHIFRNATKLLFVDSNKCSLSTDRIRSFLQTLKARGNIHNWNFQVNMGTAATLELKNHIESIEYSKVISERPNYGGSSRSDERRFMVHGPWDGDVSRWIYDTSDPHVSFKKSSLVVGMRSFHLPSKTET